jgi:hypothetical protein
MLSTNLPIEVAEFSEYLPQIVIEIAMKHYQHQPFYYNMVIMTLQPLSLPVLILTAHFMLDA